VQNIPETTRDYARQAIHEYNDRYDKDTARRMNPAPAMGEILCGRWGLGGLSGQDLAGEGYVPGELFIASNQRLATALTIAMTSFLGVWKWIATNYKLEKD